MTELATSAKRASRRETAITILLVMAGLVLAICLFAAGLLWRGVSPKKEASTDRSATTIHCESRNKEEKCDNRIT